MKTATTMDQINRSELTPYRHFSRDQWARLRADTPMTLRPDEVKRLHSLNDPFSMDQVEMIYLPLSRLLSFYVEATLKLHASTKRFLGTTDGKMPFIIGIAGSVAVGKSTTARLLKALLARWPASPKVDLITTDGFLLPNAVLEAEGLMNRKGFPESYDVGALLRFLTDIKAGNAAVRAPVYSHFHYDVMPGQTIAVDRPDILILEGLNILQTGNMPPDGKGDPVRLGFPRFLDLYRRRHGRRPPLVRGAVHAVARDRVQGPGLLLPPLFAAFPPQRRRQRQTGCGPRSTLKPQREHPADASEGGPDPGEGPHSSNRDGVAPEALRGTAWAG